MTTLRDWLDEYQQSHHHPINKRLHWICVPLIVFSIACALKAIPAGGDGLNAATAVGVAALAWYARLSWQLAAGMVLVFGVLYAGVLALERALGTGGMLWTAAAVFVAAWIGQFIGHHVEGAKPSFFKDLQFLLVGPLWLLADVYRRLSIPMGRGAHAH